MTIVSDPYWLPSHLSLLRLVRISDMLAPGPAPVALPEQERALLYTHTD